MSGSKQSINSSVDYGRNSSQSTPRSRPAGPHRSGTGDTRPECRAIVDNGLICGETQTLRITEELKKLYENRLRKLDEDIGKDASGDSGQLQLKVNVLQNWVQDLLEQNAELVHTVEELEREIGYRVKLLEEKLMESARTCREYMTKVHDYESELQDVAADKEKEEHLQCRLGSLKSDICNLLKVICQAREQGVWSTAGLVFYEVTHEDIFRCSPLAVQPVPTTSVDTTPVLPLPPKTPAANGSVVLPLPTKIPAENESVVFPLPTKIPAENGSVVLPLPTKIPAENGSVVFPLPTKIPAENGSVVLPLPTKIPAENGSVVLPLPPKTPRKVKLSLELALNRINTNSTTSYDDATKQSPLTYHWTFEPPNEPCTCNPKQ